MTTSIPSSPVEFLELQRVQQAKDQGFAFFPIRPQDGMPGFAYSIGMAQHDLPELLTFFNTEEEGLQVMGLMHNVCKTMIEGVSRFDRIELLRALCKGKINATEPDVSYTPTFVKGDAYMYALKAIITRAVRYRDQFGMPQVIEMRHEGVPTIDGFRAMQMLANS